MTPERLEALAMRVRELVPNNPEHIGLNAWHPTRPYLFGPGSRLQVNPVHGADGHVWEVRAVGDNWLKHSAPTFAEAVADFL